jgi:hypothetical protein
VTTDEKVIYALDYFFATEPGGKVINLHHHSLFLCLFILFYFKKRNYLLAFLGVQGW